MRLGRAGRTYSSSRTIWVVLIVTLFALSWPGALPSNGPAATSAPGSGAHVAAAPPSPTSAASHPGTVGIPSSPEFLHVARWFYNQTFPQEGCSGVTYPYAAYNYCYPQVYNPSLVSMSSGVVGAAYEFNTNSSHSNCLGSLSSTRQRVGWSLSSDNGTTFTPPVDIGNDTCTYMDSIEPSFAASGPYVYGTFVEENDSVQSVTYYSPRSTDALGLVRSTDFGGTFGTPVTLNRSGNIGDPQVVTFGSTVYVLFENLSNSSSYWTTGGNGGTSTYQASSYHLLVSTDNGSTWSGPYRLPGLGSGAGYLERGAHIAVNQTGGLFASYFTNQACVLSNFGVCYSEGLELDLRSSTTNGSTWSKPTVVAKNVGEDTHSFSSSYYSLPEGAWVPQSSLAFSPNGSTVYVAWAGTYNHAGSSVYSNYGYPGIFFSSGSSALGGTWKTTPIATDSEASDLDTMYNVAIGANATAEIITFLDNNATYCPYTCASVLDATFSQRMAVSVDGGGNWTAPEIVGFSSMGSTTYCSTTCAGDSWGGDRSAVSFTASGGPLLGFALPDRPVVTYTYTGSGYIYNYTYATELDIASAATGATVSVDVHEGGLAAGSNWSFQVMGIPVSVTNSTDYTLSGVPKGTQVLFVAGTISTTGYGRRIFDTIAPGIGEFQKNGSVYANYTTEFQFQLNYLPHAVPSVDLYFDVNGVGYQVYHYTYCYYGCYGYGGISPATPWYLPQYAHIEITGGNSVPGVSYWNGTGNGSYTGGGLDANVTINGVINETAWLAGGGSYNETIQAQGIPATSVYHFTFDGVNYSGTGAQPTIVPQVLSGGHTITGVWANSSTAGYEYFGSTSPASPVVVPDDPVVNLSFAYVNVGAGRGNLSFEAQGLPTGTPWRVGWNGTILGSSTPWINVSGYAGTYPVSGYPVIATNGTTALSPTDLGPTAALTTSSSYTVTFASTFAVDVVAGVGGSVSGGRGTLWLAGGTLAAFTATASSNYAFGGWTGTGAGSYTGPDPVANVTVGGAITETASFFPLPVNHFNLTIQETSLPIGTWWSVFIGGVGYSSDLPGIHIGGLYPCGSSSGTYSVSVPYVYVNGTSLTRYAARSYPGSTCTNGLSSVNITFVPQYYLTLLATAGGTASATVGSGTNASDNWVQAGASIGLLATPSADYNFAAWVGSGNSSYSGAVAANTLVAAGPITEVATFTPIVHPPPRTYSIGFALTTFLAPGTPWAVTLNGTSYSTSGLEINVTGLLPGTYALSVGGTISPDGRYLYTPTSEPPTVNVANNGTVSVGFAPSYWLSIDLGAGGRLNAPIASSGWTASGQVVELNATPLAGYTFAGWTGTGLGSYSGSAEQVNLTVRGPINETAAFVPAPPAATTAPAGPASTTTWLLYGVIGIVVGLAVGLGIARMRRPGAGAPPAEPAMAEADPSESYAAGGEESLAGPEGDPPAQEGA